MLERLTYGLGLRHGLANYAAGTGGPVIWRSMAWTAGELQDHYDDAEIKGQHLAHQQRTERT